MKQATIRIAFIILSMPFVTVAVKAQATPLQESNSRESELKDSDKSDQGEISKLVQTLMTSGGDGQYRNGYAQAVGLDRPMPIKGTMVPIGREARKCQIIYETDETNGARPFCVYFLRTKKTQHDGEERYYRVSLDGRLEKVVTLRNKLDDQGRAVVEGRSRVEEDMASPDIKKAFKTEMTFWLKDWLKKQQKLDAKKTTASAAKTPAMAATASAAPAQATP